MNSSLHKELRALASNLLRWCSYKICNPTFFARFVLVNFGVESAVENSQCTFHLPFCAGDRQCSLLKRQKGRFFGNQNQDSNVILWVSLVDFVSGVFFVELFTVQLKRYFIYAVLSNTVGAGSSHSNIFQHLIFGLLYSGVRFRQK